MQNRTRRWIPLAILHSAFCILNFSIAFAQQPLDRLLARIGTTGVTLTDVKAAVGLGLVDAQSADDPEALKQVIDRQLVLAEVARFPPPEPPADAIDKQIAMMKMHAGDGLMRLLHDTGLDDMRLRDLARDTLRIQAYVGLRFGISRQVTSDDVRRYYDEHQAQFTRNGKVIPFEEAEGDARRLASDTRLRDAIAQWVSELRTRADVVLVKPTQ